MTRRNDVTGGKLGIVFGIAVVGLALAAILGIAALATGRSEARLRDGESLQPVAGAVGGPDSLEDAPTVESPEGAALNAILDEATAPEPTPTSVLIPLTYPERPFVFASIVAKVRVTELYPPRGNSESGVVPTRDPTLPPRHSQPSRAKEVFAPIRLELVEIYKAPEELLPLAGIVVHQYLGTVADYGGLPADIAPGHAVDPATLSAGDTALVFLSPIGHRDRHIDRYATTLAAELSTKEVEFEAAHVDVWYRYVDGRALSLRGGELPVGELESRVAAAALR